MKSQSIDPDAVAGIYAMIAYWKVCKRLPGAGSNIDGQLSSILGKATAATAVRLAEIVESELHKTGKTPASKDLEGAALALFAASLALTVAPKRA